MSDSVRRTYKEKVPESQMGYETSTRDSVDVEPGCTTQFRNGNLVSVKTE